MLIKSEDPGCRGFEYFDSRNRVMSNMEEKMCNSQKTPQGLRNVINQFALFQYSPFYIYGKKNTFDENILTDRKYTRFFIKSLL